MKSLIVIIGNPAARRSSINKIELASLFLQKKGFHVEMLLTEKRFDAERLAQESLKKNPRLIIAAGGDGTFNEVMNGIVRSEIPMAILPLGTTNVLAKELGIHESIEDALETALSAEPKTITLGRIELINESSMISRYFFLMAGVGFDAKTVIGVNQSLKKISGRTAYVLSGLKNFFSHSPNQLTITVDGKKIHGYISVIGNASRYGGHFKATPDADLLEPFLHTCIFKGKKRTDLLRYVFGVIRGTHLNNDDVECLKSTHIEIQGTAHIQLDGDFFGLTPAKFSAEKDALRLVY